MLVCAFACKRGYSEGVSCRQERSLKVQTPWQSISPLVGMEDRSKFKQRGGCWSEVKALRHGPQLKHRWARAEIIEVWHLVVCSGQGTWDFWLKSLRTIPEPVHCREWSQVSEKSEQTSHREFNYSHQKCSFSCHLVEMKNVKVRAGLSGGKGIESLFFWAVQTFSIMKVASRVSITGYMTVFFSFASNVSFSILKIEMQLHHFLLPFFLPPTPSMFPTLLPLKFTGSFL